MLSNNIDLIRFMTTMTLSFFLLGLLSCAPVEIHNIEAHQQITYKFSSDANGLLVAVDPYQEEDRLLEYFGADLLSNGILPILIVIENNNSEDGFILVKEESKLLMQTSASNQNSATTNENNNMTSSNSMKTYETVMAVSTLIPATMMLTFPLAFVVGKANNDAAAVANNFNNNRIVDKTIYPGGKHKGFLYFKIKNKGDIDKIHGLELKMKNIRSNNTSVFEIKL